MYHLVFQNQTPAREPFVTSQRLVWFGRDPSCQLRLADNGVSDRHAAIERRDDGYYVRDLGSANGVRINGQLVTHQRLASGDELELGSVRLRFEILHEPPRLRRPVEPLQLAAVGVVAATILGQVVLISWIVSQPHSRGMRLDIARSRDARPTAIASADGAGRQTALPVPAPARPASPGLAASTADVLNRMIRIARADALAATAGGMIVTIQAKAQVGERELDVAATAICVQFFFRDTKGSVVPLVEPVWLKIPLWDNFTSKSFTVRYPGPPGTFAGYIVRSYYRRQLQDVAASSPTLLALAPAPVL